MGEGNKSGGAWRKVLLNGGGGGGGVCLCNECCVNTQQLGGLCSNLLPPQENI